MQEIRLDGFKAAVDSAKNIVITNHTNPDGDAMGSALALKRVLEKLGKSVSVIVPNPYPEFLWHLSGNDSVMIYSDGKLAANAKIEAADMIFHQTTMHTAGSRYGNSAQSSKCYQGHDRSPPAT